MGFSEKHQIEGGLELEARKWVIGGIAVRSQLHSISTKAKDKETNEHNEDRSTTPTAREARIPEKLPCPPAPRKRRPSSMCNFNGGREFFNPPDLETVFIRRVERAN
ncbi:hypothetical protein Nepgr_008620 [Nepenthes gracilis]|uniref:Cyclin-dependent protein kinase inhibitor SMR6 n=1 Tax=Nepenthes gracilis TaxID=150966 RepID=A0AAD3XJK0_NEPGR|nr:hypothetical protein Nepgr_008620 [Nepenthes gracilis]